eukprot:Seg4647.1 transcript_id=Seg4647.1/GoldUCD/mRNA.D3Y31 product="hypothetical protein" protein_id=Seg4647.1/GoldUCD/D3Y31
MLAHPLILLEKLVFESLRGKSHRRSSLKICEVLRLPENMKLILIIATLVVIASITMAKPRSKFIGGLSVKEIGKMTKEIDMDEYHEQVEHLVELTRYSSCLQKAVECFARTPGKNQQKCQDLKKECEKFNIVVTEGKEKKPAKSNDDGEGMKPKKTTQDEEEDEKEPIETTKAKQEKKPKKSPGLRANH